jgi:hypothetical protein
MTLDLTKGPRGSTVAKPAYKANAVTTPISARLTPADQENLDILKERIGQRTGKAKVSNSDVIRLALAISNEATDKLFNAKCGIL